MKKITLLIFLILFSFSYAQEVLNEDFNASLALPIDWTNNDINASTNIWTFETGGETPSTAFGTPNTILYDNAGFTGNYAVFDSDTYGGGPENAALESIPFDCTGLTNVVLTFNHFYLTGYGGEAYVEVYDGSTWIEVAAYTEAIIGDNPGYVFGGVTINVSTQLANVSNAQVRFRWTGDYAWFWTIDNVIVQQPTVSAPNPVTTPTPTDTAIDVYVDPTDNNMDLAPDNAIAIAWTNALTGDAPTEYDIYLGDSPGTLNLLGTTANMAVSFINMDYSTLYYWQIVAKNISGEAVNSATWSFTTQADPTLSVEDESISLFSVNPNPVKDVLNISTSLNIDSINVYNQLGQRVLHTDNLIDNTLDVSSLNNGVYILRISAEGKKKSLKIIKE